MRRVSVLIFGLLALLLAGCFTTPTPQPTLPLQPASTQVLDTPAPTFVVVTATAEATAAATDMPAVTTPPDSITVTNITDLGNGKATVYWDAVGNFPAGFKLVWSEKDVSPTFPQDDSIDVSDPAAKSAPFSGEFGKIYYIRICRFVNNACDLYSNLGIFAFFNPTPTIPSTSVVLPTNTPVITGTSTPDVSYIIITSIVDAGLGKARIHWDAGGTYAYGFRIVYSRTHNPPVYGTDQDYRIDNGAYRTAFLDGTPGATYYYRVCRFTGITCDLYSNVFTYTYSSSSSTATALPTRTPLLTSTPLATATPLLTATPKATATAKPTSTPGVSSIDITGVSNVTPGTATVFWSASGSFPEGFMILYSRTNQQPTLSDGKVHITDGNARSGNFTGTPGETYYVRVCKYYQSKCTVYSSVIPFSFAP